MLSLLGFVVVVVMFVVADMVELSSCGWYRLGSGCCCCCWYNIAWGDTSLLSFGRFLALSYRTRKETAVTRRKPVTDECCMQSNGSLSILMFTLMVFPWRERSVCDGGWFWLVLLLLAGGTYFSSRRGIIRSRCTAVRFAVRYVVSVFMECEKSRACAGGAVVGIHSSLVVIYAPRCRCRCF